MKKKHDPKFDLKTYRGKYIRISVYHNTCIYQGYEWNDAKKEYEPRKKKCFRVKRSVYILNKRTVEEKSFYTLFSLLFA